MLTIRVDRGNIFQQGQSGGMVDAATLRVVVLRGRAGSTPAFGTRAGMVKLGIHASFRS